MPAQGATRPRSTYTREEERRGLWGKLGFLDPGMSFSNVKMWRKAPGGQQCSCRWGSGNARPFPSLPVPSPHSPSEPTSQHLDPGEGSSPLENIQGLKLLKSLLQCLVLASSAH